MREQAQGFNPRWREGLRVPGPKEPKKKTSNSHDTGAWRGAERGEERVNQEGPMGWAWPDLETPIRRTTVRYISYGGPLLVRPFTLLVRAQVATIPEENGLYNALHGRRPRKRHQY